jgi:hypothetical protein
MKTLEKNTNSSKEIIGYKATNNYFCRNVKFTVGQTNVIAETPIMCFRGFHFCKKASDVLKYYSYEKQFKLLKVRAYGEIICKENKCVTNKLEVLEEITDPEKIYNLLGQYKKFDDSGDLIYHKFLNSNGEVVIHYKKKNSSGLIVEQKDINGLTKFEYLGDMLIKKTLNGKVKFELKFDKKQRVIYENKNGLICKTKYDDVNNRSFKIESGFGQTTKIESLILKDGFNTSVVLNKKEFEGKKLISEDIFSYYSNSKVVKKHEYYCYVNSKLSEKQIFLYSKETIMIKSSSFVFDESDKEVIKAIKKYSKTGKLIYHFNEDKHEISIKKYKN